MALAPRLDHKREAGVSGDLGPRKEERERERTCREGRYRAVDRRKGAQSTNFVCHRDVEDAEAGPDPRSGVEQLWLGCLVLRPRPAALKNVNHQVHYMIGGNSLAERPAGTPKALLPTRQKCRESLRHCSQAHEVGLRRSEVRPPIRHPINGRSGVGRRRCKT